jgi:geranylgeranylglycerol-phosphate geranylgeranyltransferase
VIDLWRLARAHNLGIAAGGVLAGGWIALEEVTLPRLLAFAALSAIGLGAAGNAANDVADLAADRVNRPERPLAAGRIRPETAHLLVWLGALLGLGCAALVSGRQVLVGAIALVVMLGYSPWLKRRGLLGNLAVAAIAGLPLLYGALAVGRAGAGVVPWVLAAWLHLARELVKDLQDEAGDRAMGRRTLPVRLGPGRAARAAWWCGIAFVPLSVALPLAAGFGAVYFAVALASQVLVVLAALGLGRGQFARASLLLKAAMVIGLVALVLGGIA